MKIDLHTHILPRDWPDLDAKYGYGGFVRLDHYQPCCARMMIGDRFFREITDNVWDPKRRIEECDRAGVSMQVLSTVPVMFSYWAKPADALDLSRRLNDHIAEVVRDTSEALRRSWHDPDAGPRSGGAASWSAASANSGLRGAQIGTHVDANPHSGRIDTLNLDNASLQPVWSAAEQLGAAIFVHPWDMAGKGTHAKILAAVARRHAGRNFARDLLDDFRRRLRAVSQTPRRLRAWRRRVSIHDRPHRARLSRAAGSVRDRQQGEPAQLSRPWRRLRRASMSIRSSTMPTRLRLLLKLFGAQRVALGIRLSVPVRRSAPGQTHRIDAGFLTGHSGPAPVTHRQRVSWDLACSHGPAGRMCFSAKGAIHFQPGAAPQGKRRKMSSR